MYLSLRSKPLRDIVNRQSILLPNHAARHASRLPTPPREKRACRDPGLAAYEIKSEIQLGELAVAVLVTYQMK